MTHRRIIAAFVVSIGASIGLIATYLAGGNPQWEGALLGVALSGIGWGLVVAAHDFFGDEVSEDYRQLGSSDADSETAGELITEPVSRRAVLFGVLAAALGAFAVALGFPVRSLSRAHRSELFETGWVAGRRVVDSSGVPVSVDTLDYGSAITVMPEGGDSPGDSAVMLIRVEPERLEPVEGREGWSPEGYVAYSKICTHAGCPVGLFNAREGILVCPCHQSSFDALGGAAPRFGPAGRPLPQLPLTVDADGFLVADGPFSQPVGPGFSGLPGGRP